ncbi:class I SAM-dependent methyltransferase [Streptomyces sp. NPDC085540]|uniref:class I SAM-dependent methyltransferase n=1 Tax=Streptomyces sp. NPDC085540 TaxID=3365730 RepID=UPI0037D1A39B
MTQPKQTIEEFDAWVKVRSLWTGAHDAAFYRDLVAGTGRPAVDLGIGDGRVAVESLPDIGIDISPESLRRCAKTLEGTRTKLVEADLADYSLDEQARLSYSSLNTFNHIIDTEHRLRVMRNVLRNTQQGGYFVFDAANTSLESLLKYDRIPVEMGRGEDYVFYLNETILDRDRKLTTYHGVLEHLDGQGTVTSRTHLPPLHRAYVSAHQFAIELNQAGWQIDNLYGEFDLSPYTEVSRKQIWVAIKP